MPITINGSGTLTGLSAGGLPDASITSDDIAAAAVTPAKLSQPLTLATAQNTTSGTSIDFTSIPSWARRVTVMLNGVSTSGTSNLQVQLGTSGGLETSGYLGACSYGGAGATAFNSSGLLINNNIGASSTYSGIFVLAAMGSNMWAGSGVIAPNSVAGSTYAGGAKTLSGTLDRIRLTTVNGTDTFDAGSVNIMYEG